MKPPNAPIGLRRQNCQTVARPLRDPPRGSASDGPDPERSVDRGRHQLYLIRGSRYAYVMSTTRFERHDRIAVTSAIVCTAV